MNPLISVITSTYNWPKALSQAIPTVLYQTFTDFEYLIVGDCCTDETEQVVKSFRDQRIHWYNLPKNTGNQSGVNKFALEKARGKYIAYLNHDDLWFPDHLEIALEAFRSRDPDIVNTLSLEIAAENHHYRGILGLPQHLSSGDYSLIPMTTSVIHTAEAARLVGGWVDWRETHGIPTQEFFAKLITLRYRFAVVSAVTSLKFHSADRRNSYILGDALEQEMWAKEILRDPNLRLKETLTALACESLGDKPVKLSQPAKPKNAPTGWQIEQWRRMRGLAPMLDLQESEPKEMIIQENKNSLLQAEKGSYCLISPIAKN
jgi:glycosyltransferase involved in cell wall biosynthesis